ncbi:hypothetical protein BTM25_13110 [Actinomadura rubteroloni]|uniref:Uncharacterized protein n=1 Tax=Actinomadura rubteroloni TaxID=1926885 RepID=A0A2P4UPE0_9ACTN|nr:hypothetical protein [Actinomadura rubteroloni]POM26903.1 hypothetical protein BTM25_13110 [Actinomadura rubteroloni]
MEGYIALVVMALLCAFVIRWTAQRLRMSTPARSSIMVVFVIVVLALFGRHLNGG